ncbi:MAG: helix-turn-helix transcriptional regulator [Clostridia bacterium]|nr:helix-turn-helix transcriptional regulator [Clostridia bacterium]
MIADKIKILRERQGMTQTELAKKLGITRSGVNAWEMGISIPSTQYIVELSLLFNVSCDYLLGLKRNSSVSVDGLTQREIASVLEIIDCYKESHKG